MRLVKGLYEQVINCGIKKELKNSGDLLSFDDGNIDVVSVSKVLSD